MFFMLLIWAHYFSVNELRSNHTHWSWIKLIVVATLIKLVYHLVEMGLSVDPKCVHTYPILNLYFST